MKKNIGVVIILFFLVILGAFLFVKNSNKSIPVLQNSASVSSVTGLKASELIEVEIPAGWEKSIQKEKSINNFYSPEVLYVKSQDLTDSCCGGPQTNAISISFRVYPVGDTTLEKQYQEIYESIHTENPSGALPHDLTRTTIAGNPALSSYYDFEGHSHTYSVWHGDQLWDISINSPFALQEEQYQQEINEILSSIKFIK